MSQFNTKARPTTLLYLQHYIPPYYRLTLENIDNGVIQFIKRFTWPRYTLLKPSTNDINTWFCEHILFTEYPIFIQAHMILIITPAKVLPINNSQEVSVFGQSSRLQSP